MAPFHKLSFLKVPKKEDLDKILEAIQKFANDAKKDGKPYILSLIVGPAEEHPRSEGYTLATEVRFATREDMNYYDDEDPAHIEFKQFVWGKTEVTGYLPIYFTPQIIGGIEPAA